MILIGALLATWLITWGALPSWTRRLAPIPLLGGAHLIYNIASVTLSLRDHKPEILTLTAVSYLIFVLFARRPVADVSRLEFKLSQLKPNTFAIVLVFAASIITYTYQVALAGSLPVLAANPNLARTTFYVNGYLGTITFVGLASTAICCGMTIASRRHVPIRRQLPMATLVAVPLLALGATGNRGQLLYPAVVLLLIGLVRFRPRVTVVVPAALALAIAFSVAGYYRNLAAFGQTYDDDLAAQGFGGALRFLGPLTSYLGGTADTFARTLDFVPSRVPYAYGEQFFSPLLLRESVDLYLKALFNLNFEGFGLALGAMNAFYLDFGIPGVLVGFATMGWVTARVYQLALTRGGKYPYAYVLLCCNILLSNYGHPFAYISTVAVPIAVLLLLDVDAGRVRESHGVETHDTFIAGSADSPGRV